MYVHCELMGGLGNQLFQIANVIAYAQKYNLTPQFRKSDKVIGKRYRKTYWDTMLTNLSHFVHKDVDVTGYHTIKESSFSYKKLQEIKNKNIKMDGYFQSHKYFDEYKDIIKNYFLNNKDIQDVTGKWNKVLNNGNVNVSVHVRRGDYLKYKNVYNILDDVYYKNAIDIIKQKVGDKINLFLMSDNLEYASSIISCDSKILVDNKNDYHDIVLMALCDHHIIANSTFSWWGSYLSTNKESITIAPKVWFVNTENADDLKTNNMISI